MEDKGVKLQDRPDSASVMDTAEADRLRVLEEKKGRREAAARVKRAKIRRKRIITLVIVLLVIGGITFGMYSLFHEEEPEMTVMSDVVQRGSITSMVTGSGETKALKSATMTLTAGGTVQEVFVTEGQQVKEGDPLYTVDNTEARKAVDEAQKAVDDYMKQISTLNDTINKDEENRTISAQFDGKLIDAPTLKVGDTIAVGEKLGKLVDDSTMKLSLYFSYAYENAITVGKTATISIPTTMTTVTGTVEAINKVQRISPEGSKLFEVVFTMKNPGTLTEGMGATAFLTGPSGEEIYPYEPGSLTYSRSQELVTKAGGEVLTVNLVNYASVSAGQVLVQMKGESSNDQMTTLNNSLSAANETLAKAQDALFKQNAVSPISGTVLSCSLVAGQTVEPNTVVMSIADTSTMTVEIKVDSMNISYIKTGMPCDIVQYDMNGNQTTISGTIQNVSLEGKTENGVSYFPATVQVDNADGTLRPGMYVDYSMMASQADNCLYVPQQAVKQTMSGTCVFVQAAEAPENALDPAELGMEVPEGYYAVPVTIGLSDQTNVEIKEGLEEGQTIFVQYITNEGSSWDMGGGMVVMG